MSDSDAFAADRQRMLDRHLRQRGIHDPRVLAAMEQVPRQRFVLDEDIAQAFADIALPINCDQTISQPYMVALMSELLQLRGGERVLEVGTGSGYQTAVLAELAAEVFTVERHQPLADAAHQLLDELGYTNIQFFVADGSLGLPEFAPFDRILLTAASEAVPKPLWEQLAEGGMLVGPFGSPSHQMLQVIRKLDDRLQAIDVTACRFVPLVSSFSERDPAPP